MELNASWITPKRDFGDVVPVFFKGFRLKGKPDKAALKVTCYGVYYALLNGKRVGNFILSPGYTSGWYRVQVQEYDVTDMLSEDNMLEISVAKGWWRGRYSHAPISDRACGLIAELTVLYEDGTSQTVSTDDTWQVHEGQIRFSDIYDGEIFDATFVSKENEEVTEYDGPGIDTVEQQGEIVCERERIRPMRLIHTPKGETVIDFGQNLAGYVEISVTAKRGERIKFTHGEILDKDGNFYNSNYRTAKPDYTCVCAEGRHSYKPLATYYGFRYIKLEEFPGGLSCVNTECFTAIAVYSDIKQTGEFECSNEKLNRFYQNVLWSQRGNYLDIPTDCPQRDERLGWTGDAQVFMKAAAYNYDVERFFYKWLTDMRLEQSEDGHIFYIVPTCEQLPHKNGDCAGWSDAAVICPWTVFLFYGNLDMLRENFEMMRKWVDYIGTKTHDEALWTGCWHYGDWLALDAPQGSYRGASRLDFIASAFYAYSTELAVKAGHALGIDVTAYEELYEKIKAKFRQTFNSYETQTECVLAIYMGLTENVRQTADILAEKIRSCGNHFETGFIGTAYLLHALSEGGYLDLAYSLLLREEYPSWLFSLKKGATTVWEHWDGVMADGSFWSDDMNSFNHYSYGAVMDWVYGVAAGIKPIESHPGFERVRIEPHPNTRLDWLKASLDTRRGKIRSSWHRQENYWRYEIETPVAAEIIIDGAMHSVQPGSYTFFSEI